MISLAELRAGVVTDSAEATRDVGRAVAALVPPDTVLALHGNLGAGKTTFVQGLASGFGITESVTSPTFNLFTLHRGGQRMLIHLDAYRIEGAQAVEDLMIEDFLVSPWCLAIEWPEKVGDWLPANAWHLDLGIDAQQRHTIRLRG